MGGSHGGTGVVSGLATGEGRQDADGRADNVDGRAVIGAAVAAVARVGATDGADLASRSGGVVVGVVVVVAGSNSHEVSLVDHAVGSVVERLAVATAEGDADDNTVGAVAVGSILGDEIPGGDEVGVLEAVVGVEDLDTVQLDLLGHAVRLGGDGAGAVGAVTEIVTVRSLNEGLDLVGTALELGVAVVDTRVGHVGTDALAAGGVIGIAAAALLTVRDTGETPSRATLGDVSGGSTRAVLLNVLDLVTL